MINNLITELQLKDKAFLSLDKDAFIKKYINNEIILIQDKDTLSLYDNKEWNIFKTKYSYVMTRRK